MTYYDEQGNIVENPDLTKGYIYRKYSFNKDTHTTGEHINIYHAYTEEELAEIEEAKNNQPVDYEARIAALEEELAAAKILLGVE